MSRKICSAGVRGPYSYVIVDTENEVVSTIADEDDKIVTTHVDMDFAERWTDHQLRTLMGSEYETD